MKLKIKLKNLSKKQLIKLCEMRLKNKGEDFSEVCIEDNSFKYFNGTSFIVKSDKFADYRFSFSFDMFYPDEFKYLLGLGVKF